MNKKFTLDRVLVRNLDSLNKNPNLDIYTKKAEFYIKSSD